MNVLKTNKLKFKFGLPSAVSSELSVIKDIAQKAFKKVDKKTKGYNKKRKAYNQDFINKFAQIKTSQKILPAHIKKLMDYLYILRERHQIAFPLRSRPSLKKGITRDIAIELGISHNMAKKFIAWYSFSKEYLQLHKADAPRYDLRGVVVGRVTAQEALEKEQLLDKIWAKGRAVKSESK
jgi:hypothetical protein